MLNLVIHFMSFGLFILAFYGLYLLSDKQIKITQQRWQNINIRPKAYRMACFALCGIGYLLLAIVYGFSIAFVAMWIFLTPLVFILILWLNLYKHRQK